MPVERNSISLYIRFYFNVFEYNVNPIIPNASPRLETPHEKKFRK